MGMWGYLDRAIALILARWGAEDLNRNMCKCLHIIFLAIQYPSTTSVVLILIQKQTMRFHRIGTMPPWALTCNQFNQAMVAVYSGTSGALCRTRSRSWHCSVWL